MPKMKENLVLLLLLLGLVIGSASGAVFTAFLVMRPSAPDATAPDATAQDGAETAENPEKEGAQTATESKKEGEEAEDKEQFVFTMEDSLIVNVYDTKLRRYLSAKPVFVMVDKDALARIEENTLELKHELIIILKGKTLDQLDDPQITNIIGREIQETANLKLDLGAGIARVYFPEWVVQ